MARKIFQGQFTDGMGRVVSGGTATVYLADSTTLATIYTVSTGGSADADSAVSSDTRGFFSFYVDETDYKADQKFKIILSATNTQSQTYDNIVIFTHELPPFRTFTANDATPSVKGGTSFKTANTVATTITTFHDGYDGQQMMVVIGDVNTTIDFTGTTLKGNTGADWTPTTNDHLICVYDGTNWYCRISDNTA